MAQKVFVIRDAHGMLDKLRWECINIFNTERFNVCGRAYHSFNCAVTAWHLTDWAAEDISAEACDKIRGMVGKDLSNHGKVAIVQAFARTDSRALRLCEQIANGSKHCLLTYKTRDPAVRAAVSKGEGYKHGNPMIFDETESHAAITIFWEALIWWEGFIHAWNICPEEPFVPMGDSDGPAFPPKRVR
jgi:hypothetical protein